jgi:splicing factor 3A subunit 1
MQRPPDHRSRNRESRNPQFDFLKGHHFLFNYFTALVESYTRVLNPEESLLDRLKHESEDRVDILERAFQKLDWEAHVEKERQRQVRSDSRVLMSVMIGGHDGICLLCGTAENHVFGLSA